MFRYVPLPDGLTGRLYLHSMPGRFEPLEESIDEIRRRGIGQVICLASEEEIEAKSPPYARLLANGNASWRQVMFPIVDFGVPGDRRRFLSFVVQIAQSLRAGDYVLVHCAAGIGRTGLVATSVLVALGLPVDEALRQIEAVGSHPERPEQLDLIRWIAGVVQSPNSPSGDVP
jgi:protein-tyrosine phosphatase